MTTTPDPKTVREIARKFLTDPDVSADELDYLVRSYIGYVGGAEHTAWRDAVRADADEATVTTTASWPDEQPQDERDALRARVIELEQQLTGAQARLDYLEGRSSLTPYRRAALETENARLRAKLESAQAERDGATQAVAEAVSILEGMLNEDAWAYDAGRARNVLLDYFARDLDALEAGGAKPTMPTTGWILWDAEGRWIGSTTSPKDDGWRAVSINDAEAQEWQQRGCILDRMDEAGWRAYNAGRLDVWQFEPGSRDKWLAARDAKVGE